MTKWFAIETAPRDGSPILVARYMEDWGWIRGWAKWADVRGVTGWLAYGMFEVPGNLGLAHPTHWTPIPEPPR
jgi:hypothetical protein